MALSGQFLLQTNNRIISISLLGIDLVELLFQTKQTGFDNILTIFPRWINKVRLWAKKLVLEMSKLFACKVLV